MTGSVPVIVGIDGGLASIAALKFAVHEAQLRDTHVRAINSWPATDRRDDSGPLVCNTYEEATELLNHVIDEAMLGLQHDVLIVREVAMDSAGHALVTASRDAQLVVVGSTDRSRHGLRHGSQTVERCLRFAECPVVVVPWTSSMLDQSDIDADLRHRAQTS